jgi:hypothetical protein
MQLQVTASNCTAVLSTQDLGDVAGLLEKGDKAENATAAQSLAQRLQISGRRIPRCPSFLKSRTLKRLSSQLLEWLARLTLLNSLVIV